MPTLLLLGALWVLFVYNTVLFFRYKEKIVVKYSFYLISLILYILIDMYTLSSEVKNWDIFIIFKDAFNYVVILSYASFLMEVASDAKQKTTLIFKAWNLLTITTIVFIIGSFCFAFVKNFVNNPIYGFYREALRFAFLFQGVWAIIVLFPLIKGKFVNLIKWGGGVYLFFMILVQISVFSPNKTFLGIYFLYWFYIGTFIEIIIFSFAISYKVKEALLKTIEVRTQLARDLHDEIGASLSGIKIFSQLVKDRPENADDYLAKISNYSDDMIGKMNDIVWTLNPENDSFEKIIKKINTYAAIITKAKNIELHLSVNNNIGNLQVEPIARKNIYLIVKEAINNAVKYSNASNITIVFEVKENNILAIIKDNGVGFIISNTLVSNGLKNMTNRAEEINAHLTMDSVVNVGTSIALNYKFT